MIALAGCLGDDEGSEVSHDAGVDDAAAVDASDVDGQVGDFICDFSLPCMPATASNQVSLCGQLVDTSSAMPIRTPEPWGESCDVLAPATEGPCALTIEFHDPLVFVADPDAPPLPAAEIFIDDCGRFRGFDVSRPSNDYVGVVVDDAAGVDDARVTTIQVFATAGGQRLTRLRASSTTHATDDAWTTTAGRPFGGLSFAEHGVYLPVFVYRSQPHAGVVVTPVSAGSDYYFSDADAARTAVDPSLTQTGANGSALVAEVSLLPQGGTGAPAGCEWPTALSAIIQGVVFYQERHAHVAGDASAACP